MQKRLSLTVILLLLAIGLLFFLWIKFSSRSTQQLPASNLSELKTMCCRQCLTASGRDVRGLDISGEPCSFYQDFKLSDNQGQEMNVLSPYCVDFFNKNNLVVLDCR